MNAQLAPEEIDTQDAPEGARALLRSVVITDLCDSTALVDRLGDVRATELIRAHDRLLRGLIREHRGQEIDKTDGFLSLFERPIQAVAFALAYQRGLRAFSLEHGIEVSARIGLHVGEVMTWQNDEADVAKGAKPTEVEGLAKPVAARLMGMALPGQILLSGVAYTLAHRAEGELGAALSRVQWKSHGDFRFKGVAEAVPVYEIGEEGIAPFKAPAWSGKAHREVPLWRRPTMLAFEAIALIVAVALPAWHFLKPEPAIAFAERDHVVLADLRNLTGDPRFDDSLEQALRIGLEQSRHVNVVSDLKLQRTLELMRLDPRTTAIDRKIGSELAQRERATLLILPTLAELGGRLRLTVEVVDPYSQVSVFSTSADAIDSSTLVAGVDESSLALRRALGEPMKGRPEGEVPLAQATTSQLDALRAYSLGVKARSEGRPADAEALFRSALEIDSDFALARVGVAEALRDQANRPAALSQLELAIAQGDRLPVRERLIAQANLHMLRGEGELAIRAWSTTATLYPDSFPAHGGLAWSQWIYGMNLDAALKSAEISASEENPFPAAGRYLTATLRLAKEDYEGAEDAFKRARADRPSATQLAEVALYSANRIWDQADNRIKHSESLSISPISQWYLIHFKAVIALDKGNWSELKAYSDDLQAHSRQLTARHQRGAESLALTAAAILDERDSFMRKLESFRAEENALDPEDPESRVDSMFRRLLASSLASSRGLDEQAIGLLEDADSRLGTTRSPALSAALASTRARVLSAQGHQEEAWSQLDGIALDQEAHWMLSARASVAVSAKKVEALGALRLCKSRRGLAYTENRADRAFLPYNIMHSNLAAIALGYGRSTEHDGLQLAWRTEDLPVGIHEMLAHAYASASRTTRS